jgi:hypothetical protein
MARLYLLRQQAEQATRYAKDLQYAAAVAYGMGGYLPDWEKRVEEAWTTAEDLMQACEEAQ